MLQGTAAGGGGCRPNRGRGLQTSPGPGWCTRPEGDGLTPAPPTARGHRRAWLTEAAHVQGGQQRAELGQRRCGREREALGDPAPLSTAIKNKEKREAGMGWGHPFISPRGGHRGRAWPLPHWTLPTRPGPCLCLGQVGYGRYQPKPGPALCFWGRWAERWLGEAHGVRL